MKAKPIAQPVCGLKLCSDELDSTPGVTADELDYLGVISRPKT